MFNRFLGTESEYSTTILRLALGAMILPHGAQKLLGLWDGPGLTATLQSFEGMGIPIYLAWAVVIVEFFGGIGLIIGFLTRLWAFGVGVIMAVAIVMVHWPVWWVQKGGIEFHILALAIAIAVTVRGGGAFSLDRRLSE